MKRIFILLGIFILIISFFACSTPESNQPTITEPFSETTIDNASYLEQRIREIRLNHRPTWETRFFMSRGFDQQIRQASTVIDLAQFDAENDMFMMSPMVYDRFTAYWQIELSYVLDRLYSLLDGNDAEMLRREQDLWEELIDISMTLNASIYDSTVEDDQRWVADVTLSDVRLFETRKRTLELMEYYYRLTGEVVFVFEE